MGFQPIAMMLERLQTMILAMYFALIIVFGDRHIAMMGKMPILRERKTMAPTNEYTRQFAERWVSQFLRPSFLVSSFLHWKLHTDPASVMRHQQPIHNPKKGNKKCLLKLSLQQKLSFPH